MTHCLQASIVLAACTAAGAGTDDVYKVAGVINLALVAAVGVLLCWTGAWNMFSAQQTHVDDDSA
jgi:hypothetical protein